MPKRSASDAAKTRERIVEVATHRFSAHGFAATRTAAVVRDAGVSEGALFHHFKDKTALFRAVVERLQQQFVMEVVASTSGLTAPMEVFLTGSRRSLELSENSDYLRIVMMEAQTVLGGSGWREQDARIGLMLIEPNLRAIAGRDDIPESALRPMALLVMGLINETIFALARNDAGVTIDGCIRLLEAAVLTWVQRLAPAASP